MTERSEAEAKQRCSALDLPEIEAKMNFTAEIEAKMYTMAERSEEELSTFQCEFDFDWANILVYATHMAERSQVYKALAILL